MKDVEWAFTSIRRLGASGSVVDQVRNRMSDLTYARKKLRRGEDPKSRKSRLREFRTELQALHKVHHEHLIACVGSYTDENVFELPNSEHVNVTTDKTSAVAYLHEQKIRHNDIKPTNILIHEGRVLICDFGISKDWEGREEGTTSGTIQGMTERYCAPEIKFARDRNETSDVFSLGCVFLEMLTVLSRASIDELNRFLTDSRTSRETTSGIVTFWSNINKIVAWLDQLALPDEFELVKSLVTQMVKENPRLRLKAFKVVEVLQKTSKFIGECCGGSASSTTRNPLPDIRVNNQALDSAATKHASSTTETGYDIANPASGTWTPPSTAEASPDLNTSSDKTSGGNKPVDSLNESPGTKSLEYQGTRSTDVQSMGSEPQQTSISLISKTLIPENNPEGDLDLVLEVDLIGFKVIRGCLTSGKSDGSPGDVGMQLKIYQTRKQMWEITRRLKITTFNPEAQSTWYHSSWLPLCDICLRIDGDTIAVSWSDCNHDVQDQSRNYHRTHSKKYDATNTNNELLLHFVHSEDGVKVVETLEHIPNTGDEIKAPGALSLSSGNTMHLFESLQDFQESTDEVPEQVMLLRSRDSRGSTTTRMFIVPTNIDISISPQPSEGALQFHATLFGLQRPTYLSDAQNLPHVSDRLGCFASTELQNKNARFTFERDRALLSFLQVITGWEPLFFAIIPQLKEKGIVKFHDLGQGLGAELLMWRNDRLGPGKGALTFRLQDDDNTHERWITGLLPRTGVIKNSRSKEAEIVLGAVSKSDKLDRGDIKCKTKHKVHDSKFRILFSTEHDLHSFSNAIHDYESHASFALVPTTTISVSSERRNSLRTMNS
ncbi:hypothetical protein MBLNU459_g8278t1 [Dothideomycetes sp. NU459]